MIIYNNVLDNRARLAHYLHIKYFGVTVIVYSLESLLLIKEKERKNSSIFLFCIYKKIK